MRQHRVAAQGRRLELVEHHPIADHMLDAVGHHRHGRVDEVGTEARVTQRGKRTTRGGSLALFGLGLAQFGSFTKVGMGASPAKPRKNFASAKLACFARSRAANYPARQCAGVMAAGPFASARGSLMGAVVV